MKDFRIKKCEPTHELVKGKLYYDEVNKTFMNASTEEIIPLSEIACAKYAAKSATQYYANCGFITLYKVSKNSNGYLYLTEACEVRTEQLVAEEHQMLADFIHNTLNLEKYEKCEAQMQMLRKEEFKAHREAYMNAQAARKTVKREKKSIRKQKMKNFFSGLKWWHVALYLLVVTVCNCIF